MALSNNFFCVDAMYYSAEYDVCDVTLSVYSHRASFPPWPGTFFKLARCGYTLRVTSQTPLVDKNHICMENKWEVGPCSPVSKITPVVF